MTSGPAVWHCIFLYVGRATSAVRVAGVDGLTRVLLHGAACEEMLFDRRELQALNFCLSQHVVNTLHGTRCTPANCIGSEGHTRTTPNTANHVRHRHDRANLRCHCYRTRALDRGIAHLPSGCPSGHPPAAIEQLAARASSGLQPRRRLAQPPGQLARAPRSRGSSAR